MKTLIFIQFLKAVICALAAYSVFVARLYDLRLLKQGHRWLIVLLCALAALAVPAYFDFGQYPKHGSFTNPHDFFHYYLGSKYWDELGYFNIYNAVVVATTENNGTVLHRSVRNQQTYRYESAQAVMRRAEEYRALFTAERWKLFKEDVAYFQSITKESRWPGVVHDKGYNATPVWNMTASFLTNHMAPASRGSFLFLVSLDLLFVCGALLLIWRAFGPRVMLFALIFFAAHYTMSFPHIRGGFMRMDWVMGIVAGICLIKLGWYKTAAAVMAYAAMVRIFPVLFVGGLGCKMLWDIYSNRKLERRYLEFFSAFVIACTIIGTASVVHGGGVGHWGQFFEKIRVHDNDIAPVRVGYRYVFLNIFEAEGSWSEFRTQKIAEFQDRKLEWYAVQAVVLLMFLGACRRISDYESIAMGYVPIYFLTAPTFYYHIMLLAPFFLLFPKLHLRLRAVGAACMFAMCVCWYGVLQLVPLEDSRLSYFLSITLLLFCLFLIMAGYFAPPPGQPDVSVETTPELVPEAAAH